jgi:UDP-glucose 4-epimerase
VLGGSGFLGAALVTRLVHDGAHVCAMARGAATALVMPHGVRTVFGDVRVAGDVRSAIEGCDVIFVLAGRSGAAASFADPLGDLSTNVGGLLSLLNVIAASTRVPKIVFPGSRLEYGRVDALPVSEDAPLRPLSPYGLHKVACELHLQLYARQFGVRFAVARLTNPYGPWAAMAARGYNVVTQMIARSLDGEPISVYGDGTQLRDYLYVDDAIDALIALCDAPDGTVVNVGSGTGTSLRKAAETIVRVCGRGSVTTVPWPADAQLVETGDFVADISKLRALGWQPQIAFEEGIERTAAALRARA